MSNLWRFSDTVLRGQRAANRLLLLLAKIGFNPDSVSQSGRDVHFYSSRNSPMLI